MFLNLCLECNSRNNSVACNYWLYRECIDDFASIVTYCQIPRMVSLRLVPKILRDRAIRGMSPSKYLTILYFYILHYLESNLTCPLKYLQCALFRKGKRISKKKKRFREINETRIYPPPSGLGIIHLLADGWVPESWWPDCNVHSWVDRF